MMHPSLAKNLEQITDLSFLSNEADSVSHVAIENVSLANMSLLSGFSMANSRVIKTDFTSTTMEKFELSNVVIEGCTMSATVFSESSWHTTKVLNSRCSGIQLSNATLKNVTFQDCKLDMANFRFSKLHNVIFDTCVVSEADFYGATLVNVQFIGSDIDRLELTKSTLKQVDIRESSLIAVKRATDLKGVTVNNHQLISISQQLAHEAGIKIEE